MGPPALSIQIGDGGGPSPGPIRIDSPMGPILGISGTDGKPGLCLDGSGKSRRRRRARFPEGSCFYPIGESPIGHLATGFLSKRVVPGRDSPISFAFGQIPLSSETPKHVAVSENAPEAP